MIWETVRCVPFSIPLANIQRTGIRKPISKERLKKLFKKISKKPEKKFPINIIKDREKLKLNDLGKIVRILRRLWQDKQDENTNFSSSKQNLFKVVLKRISEETACIHCISLDKAVKKIQSTLKKSS